MALSFASRTPLVILTCFGVAAVLGGVVFAAALREHKSEAPNLPPPLVGTDRALAATAPPKPPAPAPVDQWIMHEATAQPAVQSPAPPAQAQAQAAAKPAALDPAVGKARMLAALRQVPHGVITLSVEDDAGAEVMARKLADLFREAGWTVDESSAFGPGPPRHGLAVALGVSPADEAVREAFDAVGFQFQPPPKDAGIRRTPEIYVGAPYETSGEQGLVGR